jgi:hypothetical protein
MVPDLFQMARAMRQSQEKSPGASAPGLDINPESLSI